MEQLALSLAAFEGAVPPFPGPDPVISGDPEVERIAVRMIREWPERLGSCEEVSGWVIEGCGFAPEAVVEEPDLVLMRWLEAAEISYRMWESRHLSRFLSPLRHDGTVSDETLAELVSKRWMSLRQGRVSRAGLMMELFLVEIFRKAGLKFSWNVKIEGGKVPDFLFPGEKAYRDRTFPSERLRVLGAKTSFKDRWRQILAEADRVKVKHGLTRDDSITETIFRQMEDQSFVVVMPKPVLERYVIRPENLISLADFIEETGRVCGRRGE